MTTTSDNKCGLCNEEMCDLNICHWVHASCWIEHQRETDDGSGFVECPKCGKNWTVRYHGSVFECAKAGKRRRDRLRTRGIVTDKQYFDRYHRRFARYEDPEDAVTMSSPQKTPETTSTSPLSMRNKQCPNLGCSVQ